jgi:hypothetical protein
MISACHVKPSRDDRDYWPVYVDQVLLEKVRKIVLLYIHLVRYIRSRM